MNTGVYVSFSIVVFSGYMPSSGIAGSYGRFIPIFFKAVSILFSIMAVSVYNPFNSVVRWINLEPVIQSEESQKGKNKYCILTPIHINGI